MTSSKLSDGDIDAVFSVFDANNSGEIDSDEMIFALKALGWNRVTDGDVTTLFKSIDPTGAKRTLNLVEFRTYVRERQRSANSADEIRLAFKLFDADSRGKLSADDLRRAGKIATGRPVPNDFIEGIMRVADLDKDGFISFDEFATTVTKGTFVPANDEGVDAAAPKTTDAKRIGSAPRAASEEKNATSSAAEVEVIDVIAGAKVIFVNGRVSKAEVRKALVALGYDRQTLKDDEFNEMFHDSDSDGDGKLTRDEYCRLLVGFGETVDGY